MATCPKGHRYKEPEGEEGEHTCWCGFDPSIPTKTCGRCEHLDPVDMKCMVSEEWIALNNLDAGLTEDCPLFIEDED